MNSPKVLCAAGAATVLIAGGLPTALAQFGTGTVTWEANDGSGWTSGTLTTTAPSVEVRMKAQWDPRTEVGYAFAGMQFDAVVTSPTAAVDVVTDARRPISFDGGSVQTLVASRFGDQIKIDDSRDTLPPGIGQRGIFPGQLVEAFGSMWFTRENPAFVFTFRLTFDAVPGTRRISSLYIAFSGGDTVSRYMRIYTSASGAQNTPSTTTLPLELVYVPAPGAAVLALTAGALASIRRRR